VTNIFNNVVVHSVPSNAENVLIGSATSTFLKKISHLFLNNFTVTQKMIFVVEYYKISHGV
jgi:hypothetical protein